jgi:hypothetical protein
VSEIVFPRLFQNKFAILLVPDSTHLSTVLPIGEVLSTTIFRIVATVLKTSWYTVLIVPSDVSRATPASVVKLASPLGILSTVGQIRNYAIPSSTSLSRKGSPANSKHFRGTYRAGSLSRLFSILHRDALRVLHLSFRLTFHAISLGHFLSRPRTD